MWTDSEIVLLKSLVADKKTFAQIVEALGRDPESVRYQLRKNGLHPANPNERDFNLSKRILKHSNTNGCKATALKYGITVDAVKSIRIRARQKIKKQKDTVSVETIENVRRNAIWYGRKANLGSESLDFASYCVMNLLSTGMLTEFKYSLPNYIREYRGDKNTDVGKAKIDAEAFIKTISEQFDETGASVQVGESDDTISDLFIIRAAAEYGLTGEDRIIFILHFHYGLSQKELAVILDKDPRQVWYLLTKIKKLVRLKYAEECV